MFPVKIITRINRRSHDFTGNYANIFSIFFNWERGKPEASLWGRRESWRVSIIHSARRGNSFILEIFAIFVVAIEESGGGGDRIYPAADREKKKKKRANRAVRHPAGRLSSRRQIAQMFHEIARKSRWLCAHRSSRVRSPWISCLGAFQLSDGSFRNYRDFGVSPKIGRGPQIRPVHVAILSSFTRPISLHPVWNLSVIPIDPSSKKHPSDRILILY